MPMTGSPFTTGSSDCADEGVDAAGAGGADDTDDGDVWEAGAGEAVIPACAKQVVQKTRATITKQRDRCRDRR